MYCKEREKGLRMRCAYCGKLKDESEFSFSAKGRGYYCYCLSCQRVKAKEYRENQKLMLIKNANKMPPMKDPEQVGIEYHYKQELKNIPHHIKAGDVFKVDGKKARVEEVHSNYVLMMYQGGMLESFVMDDMYKIIKGTYRAERSGL